MHYSISYMSEYLYLNGGPDEPNWCIVEEYEPHEPDYLVYPKGRNYLLTPETANLTLAQAQQKCAEMNAALES